MKVLLVLALFGAVATASPFIGAGLQSFQGFTTAAINKGSNVGGALIDTINDGVSSPVSAAQDIANEGFKLGSLAAQFGANAAKKGIDVGRVLSNDGFKIADAMGLGSISRFGKKVVASATGIADAGVDKGLAAAQGAISMGNSATQAALGAVLSGNGKLNSALTSGNQMAAAFGTNMVSAGVSSASKFGQQFGQSISSFGNQLEHISVIPSEEVTVVATA